MLIRNYVLYAVSKPHKAESRAEALQQRKRERMKRVNVLLLMRSDKLKIVCGFQKLAYTLSAAFGLDYAPFHVPCTIWLS